MATIQDIKDAETVAEATSQLTTDRSEIVFTNDGKMVANNRAYRRTFKGVWRASDEKRKSLHFYTKSQRVKSKKDKKKERQNRKNGRKNNK